MLKIDINFVIELFLYDRFLFADSKSDLKFRADSLANNTQPGKHDPSLKEFLQCSCPLYMRHSDKRARNPAVPGRVTEVSRNFFDDTPLDPIPENRYQPQHLVD